MQQEGAGDCCRAMVVTSGEDGCIKVRDVLGEVRDRAGGREGVQKGGGVGRSNRRAAHHWMLLLIVTCISHNLSHCFVTPQ